MIVAYLQRMVITNISFLILVIYFKESRHPFPFAVCGNFFDYLIYVKIIHELNLFSPVIVKKILKTEKRETKIEVLNQMKKNIF